MTAAVSVDQTVQEWGNGLAVRITAPVAKAVRFTRGLPIKVEVVEGGVFLRATGKPKLTLAQKLKAFASKVLLAQRPSYLQPLCGQEGVRHRAADEEGVGLFHEGGDDLDLVGNLGAAHDD